jgi:hypothetical protein
MTNFFVVLALITFGKDFVKMHNIDVYMTPLIEKLQVLWRGGCSIWCGEG